MDDRLGGGGAGLRPRHRIMGWGAAALAVAVWAACGGRIAMDGGQGRAGRPPEPDRLRARPRPTAPGTAPVPPGLHPLGLAAERDGLVYVPSGYHPDRPAPLVVAFHGASGTARAGLDPLLALSEDRGVLVVATDSRGRTWDLLLGGWGADLAFLDQALDQAFSRFAVDPRRVAVAGFSDGASYALSVGLANTGLFGHVMAFSPGFVSSDRDGGRPRVFVAHGTEDAVLPIGSTSRVIVARLRRDGVAVRYEEFEGPHTVPQEVARQAMDWFLSGG